MKVSNKGELAQIKPHSTFLQIYHILEEEASACERALWLVPSFFLSFVWYLRPMCLLPYFHLYDLAWAAGDLSDILKQNEKLAAAAAAAAWLGLL